MNFKKNEKAYDSTNSEVFKMLQEAQNDPPEPGNEILQQEENDRINRIDEDRQEVNDPSEVNSGVGIRRSEDFDKYLILAKMLTYLNNGSPFAENRLED